MKHRARKLEVKALPSDFDRLMSIAGFRELPVTSRHALRAGSLSIMHKDSFDQVSIAHSQVEKLDLISADKAVDRFAVRRVW
jgi:PIN domain nuclease of toxin-antitoxin system